jgi:hypothetical protein
LAIGVSADGDSDSEFVMLAAFFFRKAERGGSTKHPCHT